MKCLSPHSASRRLIHKRNMAVALLICFMLTALLPTAFIFTHAGHTHTREYAHKDDNGTCAVCFQLQHAVNCLKQLGMTSLFAAFVFVAFFLISIIVKVAFSTLTIHTPVALKTRMNN